MPVFFQRISCPPRLRDGTTLCNRYVIKKTLKRGKVYQLVEVKDIVEGKEKIIKILSRTRLSDASILKEVEWIAQCPLDSRHAEWLEHTIDILDVCLVFSKASLTLRDVLSDEDLYLSDRHIREIALQMVVLTQTLHSDCICHRDICPENVEFTNPEFVQEMFYDFIDRSFRCRKVLRSTKIRLTFYGEIGLEHTFQPGKEQYNPPEVVYHLYCGRAADVFSLGCVITEMLAKVPLFPACKKGSGYLRRKTLLFDAVLGPFSVELVGRVRAAVKQGILRQTAMPPSYHPDPISRAERYNMSTIHDLIPDEVAQDLVIGMTRLDSYSRLSLDEVADHPFFAEHV